MIREDLLNTPIECGMKSLIVLDAVSPQKCDLKRLVTFDYLLVHSGDISGGPASLHADSPFRSGEILVRREFIQRGLDLVVAKGLVVRHFSRDGVIYEAASFSGEFLGYLDSTYAQRAIEIASWIGKTFGHMTDEKLDQFVNANIGRWGAEFADDPYRIHGAGA
jgi:hypothetical protein